MSTSWVLVDGYSVLHFWRKLIRKQRGRKQVGAEARDQLVKLMQQYADAIGARVSVVFDAYGAKHSPEQVDRGPGVQVVYSQPGKTADDTIERYVAEAADRASILVVTSDNLERQTVESLGARSMSCEMFETEVEAALQQLGILVRHHSRSHRSGRW
jgi:predicted RNA-binding protein with PIN domain